MTFKVNDKVWWVERRKKQEFTDGTIVSIDLNAPYPYRVCWHDMNDYTDWYCGEDLLRKAVNDTKIARKYYRNNISDIKDGKIWLK